jgi:hypothetical protein
MTTHDYAYWLFEATDRECGLACMLVPVPPTIDMSDEFREVYCQAFRHSLRDARAAVRRRDADRAMDAKGDALDRGE